MAYDPAYVHPSRVPGNFNGCRTAAEDETGLSGNSCRWELNGQTITGNQCMLVYSFPTQSDHTVRLTITDPAGNPVPEDRTPPYFE